MVTDPDGLLLWHSPALLGRAHRIILICERQGVPVLADRTYMGFGPCVTMSLRRPGKRGIARLKSWRIFRRSRRSPNRMSAISAAVLTLERQCRKAPVNGKTVQVFMPCHTT